MQQRPLSPAQTEAMTIRLIDAMACAILARSEPDSAKLVSSFAAAPGPGEASVIGGGGMSADDAAFCNAYLIRKLDWNDTYIGKNGGHPSDFYGAVLAAGEAAGKSGADILKALAIGNHLMLDLCDAANAIGRGWDPSTYVGLAATVAMGCVLDLTEVQLAHALAMTAVSRNMLLARTGRITSWKVLASASAVRDCLFHVKLARLGLSGPDPAFEGETGFQKMISGPLALELNPARDRTADSHLKFYPAIYHAQGPIEACIGLHGETGGAEIEEATISIYDFAIRFTADNPAKWAPDNLETADHSLPFLAAHALMRGEFGPGSLHSSLHDPAVRALCAQIKVQGDPAYSARFPQATPSRVTVRTGHRTFTREIEYIIGHPARPMGPDEVRRKFLACATPLTGEKSAGLWFQQLLDFAGTAEIGEALLPPQPGPAAAIFSPGI